MIQEFEQAVLTVDLSEYGLVAGDVGTVVDITTNRQRMTLEFFNFSGETVAVVLVDSQQIRPIRTDEVMHARSVKTGNTTR
jgi:hypothetical protein